MGSKIEEAHSEIQVMSYRVNLTPQVQSQLDTLADEIRKTIEERVRRLSGNPRSSDVAKAPQGGYTTHVDDTDIFFDISANEVVITAIEERLEQGGYLIRFSPAAEKAYETLPLEVKTRVDQKLDYLKRTPRGADTIKLTGVSGAYRTRVGDYRIVFEIQDQQLIVWILDIGHRREIYR